MRAMACAAAALMFAFTLACKDRDRQDTASRIDNAAEEAGQDVREGAEDAGNAAEEAADDVREGAKDAADDVRESSYGQRDEFRRDVRERLDRMDEELAALERDTKKGAGQAREDAVAAARSARRAVDQDVERLGAATERNWEELKRRVSVSLDSADRALRSLRSDAKPMGGTGGPS